MASTLTAAQLAKLAKLSHLKSLAARTKVVTDDLQSQITSLGGDAIKTVKVNGDALTATDNAVDVLITVAKKTTANTGYAASYQVKANGVAVGDDINIPKDWLLNGVDKGTVSAADKASGGKFENDTDFAEGDKYLDFSFNVKANGDGGTETTTHIYLNVQDLVDIYTNGNGLNLFNNEFSIKIDSTSVGGLTVGSGGLKLATVTADTYTNGTKSADGVAGAMSSADKYKLDNVSTQANKVTVTTEGSGAIEIDGTSKTVVEIAADADVATMLDEELPAPSSGE